MYCVYFYVNMIDVMPTLRMQLEKLEQEIPRQIFRTEHDTCVDILTRRGKNVAAQFEGVRLPFYPRHGPLYVCSAAISTLTYEGLTLYDKRKIRYDAQGEISTPFGINGKEHRFRTYEDPENTALHWRIFHLLEKYENFCSGRAEKPKLIRPIYELAYRIERALVK